MATPDTSKSYLVPGKLSVGCDDLSADWPHGGTGLGLTGRQQVNLKFPNVAVIREEDNGVNNLLIAGGAIAVRFDLEQFSNDAVRLLTPSSTLVSSDRVMTWPPATRLASELALEPLVFTPNNPVHWGLILYSALPVLAIDEFEDDQQVRLSATAWTRLQVVCWGRPDGTDRVARWGPWERLTL